MHPRYFTCSSLAEYFREAQLRLVPKVANSPWARLQGRSPKLAQFAATYPRLFSIASLAARSMAPISPLAPTIVKVIEYFEIFANENADISHSLELIGKAT